MRNSILVLGAALAAIAFPTWAVVPAASQTQVIEFYHAGFDHYFITADTKEAADLDTGVHSGWKRTGLAFQGIKVGAPLLGTNPVCRFYGKPEAGLDSHFYSSSAAECAAVKQKFADQWQFESEEVFRAFPVDPNTGKCPADTEAIHRLWNKRADVNHRYTNQLAVFQQMVAKGYTPEGDGNPSLPVVFCVPKSDGAAPAPAPPGTPSCTLAASTSTPAVGSLVTLTATCTINPTSFTWTGCVSSTLSCTTTSNVAGTTIYSFSGANAVGTGNTAQLSVAWQGASGPVPICTLSGTTTTPQTGSNLVLSANCSQTPTRYDWMECNYMLQAACNLIPVCSSTSANCAITTTIAGFAHYALAGANGAGLGSRAGFDVEWKSVGTPAPTIPSCSLTASNSNPAIGSSIVLSVSCSGNPATYTWTGCTSSGTSCSTSSATTGPTNYSVVAANATGTSSPASATVNWQTLPAPPPPPTAAPVCTLIASNMSPFIGTSVTLTASCNNQPTTYTWAGCSITSGATCVDSSANAGSVTYSVTANNNIGNSAPASVTVNWQQSSTPSDLCSAYPDVLYVTLPWGGFVNTSGPTGFKANGVLVGVLSVPSGAASTPGVQGQLQGTEYVDPPVDRTATLATRACDFGQGGSVLKTAYGQRPQILFTVTGTAFSTPQLLPGNTYYFNIRNYSQGLQANSCTSSQTCNMQIQVSPPQ